MIAISMKDIDAAANRYVQAKCDVDTVSTELQILLLDAFVSGAQYILSEGENLYV